MQQCLKFDTEEGGEDSQGGDVYNGLPSDSEPTDYIYKPLCGKCKEELKLISHLHLDKNDNKHYYVCYNCGLYYPENCRLKTTTTTVKFSDYSSIFNFTNNSRCPYCNSPLAVERRKNNRGGYYNYAVCDWNDCLQNVRIINIKDERLKT